MEKIQTALGVLGGLGIFAWPALSLFLWLFGWKPGGGEGGLSLFQGWFCALCLVAISAYYIVTAIAEWNGRLMIAGIALHAALVMAIVTLVSFTDGGILVAPIVAVGPVLWMAYAVGMKESKMAT
jgi:hypothetical protein